MSETFIHVSNNFHRHCIYTGNTLPTKQTSLALLTKC